MRAFVFPWLLLAFVAPLASAAPAGASDFWDEVKTPGLRTFRHHLSQGWKALQSRRSDLALKMSEKAIDALPDRCEGYLLRSRALAKGEELEEATAALRAALERDRACADAPEHGAPAAEAAATAGHPKLAARVLGRVLGQMRDGARRRMLYTLYGDVLLTIGPERLREAILAYREVLRHQRNVRASLGLALALRRANRRAQAVQVARKATAHGRVDAVVARLPVPAAEKAARRAVALDAVGDDEGARRAWQEASEGETWRAHAERELARLRPSSGRQK